MFHTQAYWLCTASEELLTTAVRADRNYLRGLSGQEGTYVTTDESHGGVRLRMYTVLPQAVKT